MRRGLLALAATLLAATLAADPAAARRAPCAEGAKQPLCTFQDARAVFIADGDTIRVRLGGRLQNVRFTGINAMELTRYSKYPSRRRGACHGLEATAFVERAIKRSGWKVRLAAQKLSSRAEKRLRRSVWVKQGGRWRDLASWSCRPAWRCGSRTASSTRTTASTPCSPRRRAAARKALYDPGACGAGPDQDLPIGVTVNWDADGNDAQDLNGEWVDIHNGGDRDAAARRLVGARLLAALRRGRVPGYRLPPRPSSRPARRCACASAAAPRRARAALVPEASRRSRTSARWRRDMGDGAYLFDPQGDLRAWQIYPCLVACSDPLAGKVELTCSRGATSRSRSRTRAACRSTSAGIWSSSHNAGKPDQFVFGYPFKRGHGAGAGRDDGDRPGRLAARTTRAWSATPGAARSCWPTARAS